MEELVARGLTKDIGISNFTITKTENLLKTAKIIPAAIQGTCTILSHIITLFIVECHPYLQQQKLRKYCKLKGTICIHCESCTYTRVGIAFQCYGPLGSPGRPTKESSDPVVMDDPVIRELASKYNATPAQVG